MNAYVKSVTLNGKPLGGNALKRNQIMAGGERGVEMISKSGTNRKGRKE